MVTLEIPEEEARSLLSMFDAWARWDERIGRTVMIWPATREALTHALNQCPCEGDPS